MSPFKRRIRDRAAGPTSFLASGTEIKGSISGEGGFVFSGRVEGDCQIDGVATLAEGGYWKGTLIARDVVIAGQVIGDVIAKQRVELAGSAEVTGSISGQSIAVAEGAVIEGAIKTTSTSGRVPLPGKGETASESAETKS
jgi:cytoskeletal protein CcmA (bactofilin family)